MVHLWSTNAAPEGPPLASRLVGGPPAEEGRGCTQSHARAASCPFSTPLTASHSSPGSPPLTVILTLTLTLNWARLHTFSHAGHRCTGKNLFNSYL